jgi:hypothetical protein
MCNEFDANGYMTPFHPEAFTDMVMREPSLGNPQRCLKCLGYGGWALRLNAYPVYGGGHDHFRASCDNCNGRGWTKVTDHVHNWRIFEIEGRCLRRYTCSICGITQTVDSSD